MFAVWLLLRAFRIPWLSQGAVLLTIYLSGFALLNSFYVWPKLLAAAYLLAFAIPFLALRHVARAAVVGKDVVWISRGVWTLAHGGSFLR